jgi:hypothetical protein
VRSDAPALHPPAGGVKESPFRILPLAAASRRYAAVLATVTVSEGPGGGLPPRPKSRRPIPRAGDAATSPASFLSPTGSRAAGPSGRGGTAVALGSGGEEASAANWRGPDEAGNGRPINKITKLDASATHSIGETRHAGFSMVTGRPVRGKTKAPGQRRSGVATPWRPTEAAAVGSHPWS